MKTLFYHATHKKNVGSILRQGLKLSYARNQRNPWVWLDCEPTREISEHVAQKHDWRLEDIVTLVVCFDRDFCVTHPLSITFGGLAYKTRRDIDPKQIEVL